MERQRTLELLARSKPVLQTRFGVTRLALFGVQFYLEDLLGCPVDLITEKALRPELRTFIEQERVNV